MTESKVNIIEHPEADLQLELVNEIAMLRHVCGSALIDSIKKRVDEHNEKCTECTKIIGENIKFY